MNRRFLLLAATAAALAVYAIGVDGSFGRLSELLASTAEAPARPVVSASSAQDRPRQPPSLNPYEKLDLHSLAALASRPLFDPTRKPRPEPVAEVPAPAPQEEVAEVPPPVDEGPNASDFTLLAISSSANTRIAAVRLNASNEVVYLRKGQPILDWAVLDVGDRSISIGAGGKSITLNLFSTPVPATMPAEDMGGNEAESVSEQGAPQAGAEQPQQPIEQNRF